MQDLLNQPISAAEFYVWTAFVIYGAYLYFKLFVMEKTIEYMRTRISDLSIALEDLTMMVKTSEVPPGLMRESSRMESPKSKSDVTLTK